jgi:hypothetical protein
MDDHQQGGESLKGNMVYLQEEYKKEQNPGYPGRGKIIIRDSTS